MNPKWTAWLLLLVPSLHAWETGKDYPLRHPPLARSASHPDSLISLDSAKTSGTYLSSGIAVREGGFSCLWRDPSDPGGNTFWSVTERGPVASWGETGLGFPLPDYHHKLVKLRVQGDSLALVSVDSIAVSSTAWTVGLPSASRPQEDSAFAMLPGGTVIDLSNPLANDTAGYDFEGIAGDGNGSLWLSDEYGPSIVQVDLATRRLTRHWSPGSGLPLVFAHRRSNRGFEALTRMPSGRLVTVTQSPMTNPDKLKKDSTRLLRVLELDPTTGTSRQFAYLADLKAGSRAAGDVRIPEISAVDDTTFLVLEAGEDAAGIDHVDLKRFVISRLSTDISLTGSDDSAGATYAIGGKTRTLEQIAGANDTSGLVALGIVPVRTATLLSDLLTTSGWTHPKPEGMALVDDSTVALIGDNDYGANAKGDDGMLHRLSDDRSLTRIRYLRWGSSPSSVRSLPSRRSWSARTLPGGLEIRGGSKGGPWSVSRPDGHVLARIPASRSDAPLRIQVPASGLVVVRDASGSQLLEVLP